MRVMQSHLRNTFLAGIFAVVPLAVTVFLIYKLYEWTGVISEYFFGRAMPLLGIILVLSIIYLAGLVATLSVGKMVIRAVDSLLVRVPGLRQLYTTWKHVAITPGGTEGVFSHCVLIPDETGVSNLLGFTSGRPVDGGAGVLCVFVPVTPNPVSGRLYFVAREKCMMIDISAEEAFKVILSMGNYVPTEVGQAVQRSLSFRSDADNSRV
ncbi:MAG TPA: DUF502 domain-containing protein [Tepidisphaeraceae bacterium]|nr:DUF502 domain-containing protein [Tepidisphaeraceae bacterium]